MEALDILLAQWQLSLTVNDEVSVSKPHQATCPEHLTVDAFSCVIAFDEEDSGFKTSSYNSPFSQILDSTFISRSLCSIEVAEFLLSSCGEELYVIRNPR
ncbi:hypothetical protein ACET3Z_014802 [Daucus carota]